ncbi:MAG: site-specific DNA-methyltransferase [Chloroflexi bacterium]|nr:site-specific DNA-methyltransferase [Chloroflexota bacterium]
MAQTQYGPDNPHPYSTIRTELIWEGKYDEYGNRREVDVAGAALPLQRIETVDEPRSRSQVQGLLFEPQKAHRDDFRNRLIWGDNKLVMASLLNEFKGKVDLIYIDPPFDVGADFRMSLPVGEGDYEVTKEQSTIEMVAYRDIWGRGTDSYINMMSERFFLMKDLLSSKGNIVVHVDYRVVSMIRLVMDDIFGSNNFKNELIWHYHSGGIPQRFFPRKHDTLLWYSRTDDYYFDENGAVEPRNICLECGTILEKWNNLKKNTDSDGRVFRTIKSAGKIYKYYDDEPALVPDVWLGINHIQQKDPERSGYSTQKPEKLLTRIIDSLSPANGLVADFFCGSGTSGAVAEKLGRRWIMADLGRFAIHTSRKRLIEVQRSLHAEHAPYRSFDVYNLGRYERQWWQQEALQGADSEHRRVVLEFYRAEPMLASPTPLLHARKGSAYVHVAAIDTVLGREQTRQVALAAQSIGARELTCLAWEFEMDLRMVCGDLEQELDVKIKLVRIPREIMEKNRKDPPPFFEVAILQALPVYRTENGQRKVDIKLTNFLPSLTEVPEKELLALQERAQESGFDFIDFWAVDFDYHPDQPFNHHWQAFRTRRDRSLPTVSDQEYSYDAPGDYCACVKVIDVFGADTSITVPIKI